MKVHALHQVPQGLGFKRGESGIANPPEKEKETGEKAETFVQRNTVAVGTLHKIHPLLFIILVQSYSRVGLEISIVDRFNQLLCYLDDLLFTS